MLEVPRALNWSIAELWSVTCHTGSHSVTCHPTQVNVFRLNLNQAGWYSIYLPWRDGRLSKPEKKKKISHGQLGPLRWSSSLFWRGLNPIKLLTASAFNRLGQYASSPGNKAYCYAEFSVSSLAVPATIASTHFTYPRRDGQAELARVAWFNMKTVHP